ncbi:MAG TPA: peroxiredoxin family protein [Candidatus Limnocylindria bacterium]|jgi:peroxiredoxin|nr:peroxiredoxin family protein [Candidatus Limnocylindria bacterium]
MKLFRNTIGLIGGFALAATVSAADVPKIGDKAPDFTLDSLSDSKVQLSNVSATNGAVLIVLRGWPGYHCPACTAQVHEFVAIAPQLKEAKVPVIMVYPGPAESLKAHAKDFLKDESWPREFMVALDPDYTMVNSYALRWDAPNETAYPATFIVDAKGIVRYAKISHGHGDRARGAEVLKALSKRDH